MIKKILTSHSANIVKNLHSSNSFYSKTQIRMYPMESAPIGYIRVIIKIIAYEMCVFLIKILTFVAYDWVVLEVALRLPLRSPPLRWPFFIPLLCAISFLPSLPWRNAFLSP